MHINPTNKMTSLAAVRRPDGTAASTSTDEDDFSQTQALRAALEGAEDVRPGKVAQARALIAKPNYPPEEMVQRISNLLAGHLRINAPDEATSNE